jgi:hypothetical protein
MKTRIFQHLPFTFLIVKRMALSVALLAGCASSAGLSGETVGERFRQVLADIDAECKRRKEGPYLDPSDPEYRQKRRYTDCDILKLQPRDWRNEPMVEAKGQLYPVPARWVATTEGKFAHSIKLPPPYGKPKPIPFTTPLAYFEELCKAEAGEFIFERVGKVEGVWQARPTTRYPPGYKGVVFHLIEKSEVNRPPHDIMVQPPDGSYQFFEIRLSQQEEAKTGSSIRRYFRTTKPTGQQYRSVLSPKPITVPYVVDQELATKLRANYGYTWRGIRRPNDWEHGIEGSELIVFRIEPFKVLGVQRNFVRHEFYGAMAYTGITVPQPCPGRDNLKRPLPLAFVKSILQSSDTAN